MVELSIIVPIYNVEAYLPKCLDSIIAQTYRDFECILIDDGSPDRCGVICDQYANQDERFIVIHQQNQGVSAARNAGLEIAQGKYVGFVDPDDWIEPTMYETMISAMERENVQIVACQWDNVFPDGKMEPHNKGIQEDFVCSNIEFIQSVFEKRISGASWNKLFIREMIINNFEPNLSIGEDHVFLVQYCINILVGCCLANVSYHFFQRNNSATHGDVNRFARSVIATKMVTELSRSIDISLFDVSSELFYNDCLRIILSDDPNYNKETKLFVKRELCSYLHRNWWQFLRNRKMNRNTKILIVASLTGERSIEFLKRIKKY